MSTYQWGSGLKSKAAGKVSLLASGNDGMVQTALISPMLFSIMVDFAGKDQLYYDWVISITALLMVPGMFLSSYLVRKTNKKHLIIFGTILFAAAGLACSLSSSIEFLLVARGILGFGAGICYPLIPSAIAQLFSGKEKDSMLGWVNACGSAFSFVLSTAAGAIAVFAWKASFLLYLIFVPIIVIQILCLPDFEPEGSPTEDAGITDKSIKVGWKPWFVALSMLVVMAMLTCMLFRLSPIIEANGFGNSAASGFGSSLMTAASFLAALFFGFYFNRLKRFSPVASFVIAGISMTCFASASSLPVIYAGCVFYGLALGSLGPFFMSMMSRVAPMAKMTFCMTLTCVCQIGAQVVTPYYMAAIAIINNSDAFLCGFTAVILFLIAAGVLIWGIVQRKVPFDD